MKNRIGKKTEYFIAVIVLVLAFSVAVFSAVTISDDEFRFDTPTYISLNKTVSGRIESDDEYEAYMFEVTKNGVVNISLEHENVADALKAGWKVTLYAVTENKGERAYTEVSFFDSLWSDIVSSWGEIGVKPGVYCILVEPGEYVLSKQFDLTLRFTATEHYEKEFNDIKENSDFIVADELIYGSSSQKTKGTDTDYYKLTLFDDGYIDVEFTHDDLSLPTVSWIISLENENGIQICDFPSRLSDTTLTSGNLFLKKGSYYVKIESQTPYGLTYSLKYTAGESNDGDFEVNDTPEEAIPLSENTVLKGNLSPKTLGLDKDYYKITLQKAGFAEIIFSHADLGDEKPGFNIRLLKEDNDGSYYEIVKKISKRNETQTVIDGIGLDKGDYYILIDGDSLTYTNDGYKIKYTLTENEFCEKEPNNVTVRANEISLNTVYYGRLITKDVQFDNDYYKFTVDEPCNICVQLDHEKCGDSSVAWSISISDEDDDNIATVMSSKDESAVNTGIVELPFAGTYYIHIENGMVESEDNYSFKVIA